MVLCVCLGWEVMELGMVLVCWYVVVIWMFWLLLVLLVFVVFNILVWWVDVFVLVWLVMWWFKFLFECVVLYVIFCGVFGEIFGMFDMLCV